MKKYSIYFPKSFLVEIDGLLSDLYSDQIKREHFLHFFYRLNYPGNKTGMVELPSEIRNDFGKYKSNSTRKWRFKEIIRICEERDISFSTTYSTDHHFSKSYGFTQNFLNKIYQAELELQACEVSEKTYKAIFYNYEKPSDPILLKHYNSIKELDIDLDQALSFVKTIKDKNQFLRIARDIDIIYNKERVLITEDIRTGRIFTSFNLMKKELREFCSFRGEKLKSLDLKSSQPFFLANILIKENPNNSGVKRFYNLIIHEDIYEWVLKRWGNIDTKSPVERRKFAKKQFFSYLYKKNNGSNGVQVMIKKEFPDVYEIIKQRKRILPLWEELQRIEADVFVGVVNQFVSDGCFIVHDQVYFKYSLESSVRSSLKNKFHSMGCFNYNLS